MLGLLAMVVATGPALGWQTTERDLGPLPGTLIGDLVVGPTGRHVLCAVSDAPVVAQDGDWDVYDNGKLVGRYSGPPPKLNIPESNIDGLDVQFSLDGRHYAFIGHRSGSDIAVVDSVEDPPQKNIGHFTLSPLGKEWAYSFQAGSVSSGVWNGKPLTQCHGPWRFTFSPDGKHLAWVADEGLFLDGRSIVDFAKTPAPYHEIQQLLFSPDSRHFAYVVGAGSQTSVIEDGKTVRTYDERSGGVVRDLRFSADSRRLAYFAGASQYHLVVYADGKLQESQPQGDRAQDEVVSSKDGKHFALLLFSLGPSYRVVQDGVASPPYKGAFFTPDWMLDDGTLAYCTSDDPSFSSVTTHIGSKTYPDRQLLAITPDGKHIMLANRSIYQPDHQLWIDGRLAYANRSEMVLGRFSGPKAVHSLANFSRINGESDYWLDGKDIGIQREVQFSPDEQHFAAIGKTIQADGQTVLGPECTHIQFRFDGDSHFRAYAVRGQDLIEVEGHFLPPAR